VVDLVVLAVLVDVTLAVDWVVLSQVVTVFVDFGVTVTVDIVIHRVIVDPGRRRVNVPFCVVRVRVIVTNLGGQQALAPFGHCDLLVFFHDDNEMALAGHVPQT
jgi:hypothetical protein